MAFNCVVVTPEHELFSEQVEQVVLPAFDGEMGILTDRAPVLVKLGAGRMKADVVGGGERELYLEGGVAQMKDNKLTVVTDYAIPAADLDPAAVQQELSAATALPSTDEATSLAREAALNKARAKQRLAK